MADAAGNDQSLLVDSVRSMLSRSENSDWQIGVAGMFCQLRPSQYVLPPQGWKLHLSATPLSAPWVLARAAEILLRRRCAFKFAATPQDVYNLSSARAGRASGGKFITVYPGGTDAELRTLAQELHDATIGLAGPGILSDQIFRPGSLVHYRFGAFSGVRVLGHDGKYSTQLVAPDGSLVEDRREAWFTPPGWAPRDPFQDEPDVTLESATPAGAEAVILNGRYVVDDVVSQKFKGGVYRASDQLTDARVIIKQARPHVGADLSGRDIRDVRRHEADLLERFASSGATARLIELFEQEGELFLVQEALTGITLEEWASEFAGGKRGAAQRGPSSATVADFATGLLDLVEWAHREGFAVRDLKPSNVMVCDDGKLRLIDLESFAVPGEVVRSTYTPGFAAPEQIDAAGLGPGPDFSVDLHSLGATLLFLASGSAPLLPRAQSQQLPHDEQVRRIISYLSVENAALRRLGPLIEALMSADPKKRPSLAEVRGQLSYRGTRSPVTDLTPTDPPPALERMISDGLDYLLDSLDCARADRIWPVSDQAGDTDPVNLFYGAAGVVGVLTRANLGAADSAVAAGLKSAATEMARRALAEPRSFPGLHFGRSGTAWAALEAGLSLGDEELARFAGDLAARIPLRSQNPDITHGTAGAGMTQLRFWEATGNSFFLERAKEAADAVIQAAERRRGQILWPIRSDLVPTGTSILHYGFAHGVAGIGTFLLAVSRATGRSDYAEVAKEAADTLVSVADVEHGAAFWPRGAGGKDRPTEWCSGSVGVGTFLLHSWQDNDDDRIRQLLHQAAVAVRRDQWTQASVSQCCGLAGNGEYLLDLADVLAEEQYRDWAGELFESISIRSLERAGRTLAFDGVQSLKANTSFKDGVSGVVSFLLRMRDGGPRLWIPEVLGQWHHRGRQDAGSAPAPAI